MKKTVRYALFLLCAIQLSVATAFFLQIPLVVKLWPFPGTTPLTFIFISSIFAAAAASTFWATATENYGALAGTSLDFITILILVSVLLFQLGGSSGAPEFTVYGIGCLVGAFFGLGLLLWSIRIPIDNTVPMPRPVRWSFVFFIVALVFVSTRLILKIPDTIPWKITPELSVIIGAMFLGATMYFLYALLRPSWLNSAGQLAGFLAYDAVLIGPFLTRHSVAPQHQVSHVVYTLVVATSGLLAIYYLFICKSTRIWSQSKIIRNTNRKLNSDQ